MAVLTGIQFLFTGRVQQYIIGGEDRPLTMLEGMGAGLIGGAVSGVAAGPLELVMVCVLFFFILVFVCACLLAFFCLHLNFVFFEYFVTTNTTHNNTIKY